MANYEGTRYDFDGANLTGIEGTATGTILPWSSASVPSGFLECDGTAVSRSTYADLFSVIGETYGSGDGSTTFNLPDLQDNVPVGKSGTKNLASTGGANTVTPTGNVGGSTANATLSTAQLASHSHNLITAPPRDNRGEASQVFGWQVYPQDGVPSSGSNNPTGSSTGSQGSGGGHSHNMSANFTGDANSVLQPFLTILYIIKT